jgi:formylglycine-generating enzyme required for sulfatase activity/uncharacterized caspase-like protein
MAKNWAICIGVNEYHNLPSLNFAVKDAEKMRDWFVHEAGFEPNHVYLFTDNSPPIADAGKPYPSQPTYATLIRFLDNRFENKFLSAGDNLWFFFSGHGLRHGDRDYLMLSDSSASGQLIERTAIPLNYVTERLRRCGADNVVIVQDACRNQGSKGMGIGEEKQAGVITFASCSPQERSYEIETLQHGAFTYALLESLRLQGEGNCATVERLYQRLRYRVAEINQLHKKPRQTPYAIVEPATKYHLILLPKQATLHDINALKMDAFQAEIKKDLTLAVQLWTRILVVSPADPQALESLQRIWQQPQGNLVPSSPLPTLSAIAKGSEVEPDISSPKTQELKVDELLEIWQEVVEHIPLYSTQLFFKQHCQLLEFNGLVATIKVFNENLISTALRKQKEIETAFTKFVDWKVLVKFISILKLGDDVILEMVAILAGSFMMGAPKNEENSLDRERSQHRVSVPTFLMGKYPVTQAQWRAVAGFPQVKQALEPDPSRFKGDNRPVEQVSWLDTVEFCARLSNHSKRKYRLPSEAEWEYACRAGTTTSYSFGNDAAQLENYAWYDENSGSETHPVGQKPSNAFGLFDMHGNVWEWCDDDWHGNYEGAPTDGRAWVDDNDNRSQRSKLQRGGSWDEYGWDCRSAFRGSLEARGQYYYSGFRVVCRLQ